MSLLDEESMVFGGRLPWDCAARATRQQHLSHLNEGRKRPQNIDMALPPPPLIKLIRVTSPHQLDYWQNK